MRASPTLRSSRYSCSATHTSLDAPCHGVTACSYPLLRVIRRVASLGRNEDGTPGRQIAAELSLRLDDRSHEGHHHLRAAVARDDLEHPCAVDLNQTGVRRPLDAKLCHDRRLAS